MVECCKLLHLSALQCKRLASIFVMSLNSFLEHILVCFRKRSPNPRTRIVEVASIASYEFSNPIIAEEPIPLRTWPKEKLKQTVENILTGNGTDAESDSFNYLISEIWEELNQECPFQIPDNYDFCVISARADQTAAIELIREMETNLKLNGFNFWEAVVLGRDEFEAYEDVMNRSSKVVFYITENFTEDVFCLHLARNTFVVPGKQIARKVIPIVSDMSTQLPDLLHLVDKLLWRVPHQMERLSYRFDESVRSERRDRINGFKLAMDAKRMEYLNRILVLHHLHHHE